MTTFELLTLLFIFMQLSTAIRFCKISHKSTKIFQLPNEISDAPLSYAQSENKIVSWIGHSLDNFVTNGPVQKSIIVSVVTVASSVFFIEALKVTLLLGIPLYFALEYFKYSSKPPKYVETSEVEEVEGTSKTCLEDTKGISDIDEGNLELRSQRSFLISKFKRRKLRNKDTYE